MKNEKKDTVLLTFKVIVPQALTPILEELLPKARLCVKRMLKNRKNSSSKFYPELPCTIAKSLISKYQKNKKCKEVKHLVLPLCGDKGKQIKIVDNNLKITSIFKKTLIPVVFPKPRLSFIRSVEFFKKNKVWFMSYSYETPKQKTEITGVVGVDRNSVGNVATVTNPQTGKVLRLGPDCASITKNFRNRRKKLQKKGAKNALKKIRRKQSRRIKDINHKVSRSIVDFAKSSSSAIVLEKLKGISKKKSKAKRYVQKSQWSFFQLETFIKYKADLLGIPVHFVDPAFTSQACSRCGSLNKPNGKHFQCKKCGHFDHRDSNAAFNIAAKFLDQTGSSEKLLVGHIDVPQTGEEDVRI